MAEPVKGAAFIVATMARRGLATPGPPVRVFRQLAALHHWGFGLAGELRQAAMRDPGRVAMIDERGRWTYGEILDRSSRLALALPVAAGDRVGVLCRNSAAMIETLVAATIVGADPVMINTGLSAAQLANVITDQGLKIIVHDEEFAGLLPDFSEIGIPTGRLDKMIADVPSGREVRPPERTGRTIVLTSGTTGVPKGAQRPTPGGFGPLCSIIDRIPLRAGVRVMIAAPLFHTWGFAGMQIALALRATIVLRRRFEAAAVLDTMTREACTALIAVPVMLQHIMEVADGARPPLSVVAVSGSALPGGLATRFMDRYGEVLYNLYGSTEASWVSIATPADMRVAPDTAGRPPHGTAVAILDEAGRPVPRGTTGRLFAGNEMLFEGYTNGAAREMRDGLIATGDVGHLDEAGRLYVDGREDDMIISGGENVFPAEVEGLLADLAGVREVAVIGVPDDEFGQRLAAYVVLHGRAELDADAIRDHVRKNRARFCVPRDVVFLTELPRNATGKVLKRELPR